MPDIQPFRAYTYGAAHLKNIQRRVCPPYDVISPAGRAALVKQDPFNFVRVELPEGDADVRYGAAKRIWDNWLDDGVLTRDAAPAFYVYEAAFRSPVDGRPLKRRGVFASLKGVPWGRGVHPHEKTLPTHKADRLSLFKTLRAQTSPIQLLARDASGAIARLIAAQAKGKPWVAFTDEAGVAHRLWRWPLNAAARRLIALFRSSPCAIADGHHRYETSLTYGRWAGAKGGPAARRVMAFFSSSDDAGLEVLPTHRSVPWSKRRFVNLEKWGTLTPVPGLGALQSLIDGRKPAGTMEVGVFRNGKYYRYTFDKIPAALRGTPHEKLAVAVLHAGALKGLGKEDFFFTRDPREAARDAAKNNGWAFFLAPNTVKEVLDVSTAGLVMPPKSTYFYPKIPSGILSQSLQGAL